MRVYIIIIKGETPIEVQTPVSYHCFRYNGKRTGSFQFN